MKLSSMDYTLFFLLPFFFWKFFLETHTHTTDANVSIERVGTMKTEMELLAEIISTRHMLPSNTMKYVRKKLTQNAVLSLLPFILSKPHV